MKTITIKDGTYDRLKQRGKMGESFDARIIHLLDLEDKHGKQVS